jgi:hypothetical protein
MKVTSEMRKQLGSLATMITLGLIFGTIKDKEALVLALRTLAELVEESK